MTLGRRIIAGAIAMAFATLSAAGPRDTLTFHSSTASAINRRACTHRPCT